MKTLACAIYTRKSSDEGLEQGFNSLDAQREAGEAYVKSQAAEGWRLVATRYDDGGYSGGTMERPGLQRLLADIEAGRIDVVVVYKIDRLTRSLADFARIVERFDARGVSFVSVTQAFNTTSSMGRLTLNVLLSFAQFEREVTGERIRDKIAASKAKGMWMGGIPPLGYDLPVPGSRTLVVNEAEAAIVRHIFERYLACRSVHRLASALEEEGVCSKVWVTAAGKSHGGRAFSRGALFHLLGNRIYLGEIVHKGACHPGAHAAIVDPDVFARAQAIRFGNRRRTTAPEGQGPRTAGALLAGRILDAGGQPMSPSHSRGRGGRIYRYYVSAALQQGRTLPGSAIRRLPAAALEALVTARLGAALPASDDPLVLLRCVRIAPTGVELYLPVSARRQLAPALPAGMEPRLAGRELVLCVPVAFPLRGGQRSAAAGHTDGDRDPVLIAALRKAHGMLTRDADGHPTIVAAPATAYDRKLLRLAFLAPRLQRDILAGRQPRHISLAFLMARDIPPAWQAQVEALGWTS